MVILYTHTNRVILYLCIAGAEPGMKKGGTLLLAGDSVHSTPSMGSGGMSPREIFEIFAFRDGL